jgi:hypothetical protein
MLKTLTTHEIITAYLLYFCDIYINEEEQPTFEESTTHKSTYLTEGHSDF